MGARLSRFAARRGWRWLATPALAAGLVLVPASSASPITGWMGFATASAASYTGGSHATAVGSVYHPYRMRVELSYPGAVSWYLICTKGSGVYTRNGSFSRSSSYTFPQRVSLPMPVSSPQGCTFTMTVERESAGWAKAAMQAQRW